MRSRPRRCAARSKKRVEALAQAGLVHPPAGQCRLRAQQGGCAHRLPGTGRRPPSSGLRGREQQAAGGRNPHPPTAGPRPAGPLRLRVPAPRGLPPVHAYSPQAGLAHGQGHGAAHQVGFRRCPARPDGRALPAGRDGGPGLRQPQHASPQRTLRGLPAGRGPTHRRAAGVALHAQARQPASIAELEFAALAAQCLDRRIASEAELRAEIEAWVRDRNALGRPVRWLFTTEDARTKLLHLYPTFE